MSQTIFLPSPTPESIAAAAIDLDLGPRQVLMVLLGERERPKIEDVVAALGQRETEFFGGIFPGLIFEGQRHEVGALLVPLPSDVPPLVVSGLDRGKPDLPDLDAIASKPPGFHTAVVLVDGLTANVSGLLSELHSRLGNSVHYIGGGAGSLTLEQQPCVFSSAGVLQDAAVIAFVARRSRLGVRHGWKRLEGPFVATSCDGNVIRELNWQPAFEVYRAAVDSYSSTALTVENFFRVSNAFPFGIYKEGMEDVVRDPVSVDPDGALVCVGEVPENAVLNVLRGDRESLIEAAAQAADDCCDASMQEVDAALVVDCVSRTIFLEEDFERELEVVHERIATIDARLGLHGILSLGEISSHGEGFVEFFNKTIVTAVLHG